MTIWRMRIACWIPKATNTHSEYVVLIFFPLQQWLHERSPHFLSCKYPGFFCQNLCLRRQPKHSRSRFTELTAYSGIIPETLTVTQTVNKFPAVYWTKFSTFHLSRMWRCVWKGDRLPTFRDTVVFRKVCHPSSDIAASHPKAQQCHRNYCESQTTRRSKFYCPFHKRQKIAPVLYQKIVSALSQKTVPILCQKIVPVLCQKIVPTLSQKTVSILCQKIVPVLCQKIVPALSQKTVLILFQKTVPILCQKTVPLLCQKTAPVLCQKIVPVLSQKTVPILC